MINFIDHNKYATCLRKLKQCYIFLIHISFKKECYKVPHWQVSSQRSKKTTDNALNIWFHFYVLKKWEFENLLANSRFHFFFLFLSDLDGKSLMLPEGTRAFSIIN